VVDSCTSAAKASTLLYTKTVNGLRNTLAVHPRVFEEVGWFFIGTGRNCTTAPSYPFA
jgi:hypothetical protein